jgi:hypothetical protein
MGGKSDTIHTIKTRSKTVFEPSCTQVTAL